jgi:hypothetical protein
MTVQGAIALDHSSTIYQLKNLYKSLSLFLTGRAIGVVYSFLFESIYLQQFIGKLETTSTSFSY